MNNRQTIVFGIAAAIVVILIGFGIFYDLRDTAESGIDVVKLPPASYSQSSDRRAAGSGGAVRPAAAAGQYYPSDQQELAELVDRLLSDAKDMYQPASAPSGKPYVIIAPHAGYEYSGGVAAAAFAQLEGQGFSRAVLIGRSHSEHFSGQVAVDGRDSWQTPLGKVALDKEYVDLLSEDSGIVRVDPKPHQEEHSLETSLPFLQRVMQPGFKIVPLLFGDEDSQLADKLAHSLYRLADRKTVFVVSTDLSHYPSPAEADRLDDLTIQVLLAGDPEAWRRLTSHPPESQEKEVATLACAAIAVETGMRLADRFGWQAERLAYANTADIAPESSARTVGYLAAAYRGTLPTDTQDLTAAEGSKAVQIARQAIENLFSGQSAKTQPDAGQTAFDRHRGVFVTLKRSGNLRGCVGVLSPGLPLDMAIREMAVAAATRDSRFEPLTSGEREGLEITISVLSPLEPIGRPEQIEMGKHGVQLTNGLNSGVFLPEVGQDTGWSREDFLGELCSQKAGLPRDCWQDPNTAMQVFTVQAFTEPLLTNPADRP